MRTTTLVFYGSDGAAAKAFATGIRKDKNAGAQIRESVGFVATEIEPCDRVVLLPCVSSYDADRIKSVYGDKIVPSAANLPPPPPPLAPPSPLANLPADWRSKEPGELRKLAEVVSGRAVENKKQAIEIIEAALAARSKS